MYTSSIRLDSGEIRKPELTPEGFLRAEAVFARDGILEYRHRDGSISRELRTPEQNQKALAKFGLKPISLEHPPKLITPENAKQYTVGATDSTVYYDNGYVRGVVLVYDSEAIERIQNRSAGEISTGYTARVHKEPGTWKGERYDSWQEIIDINHVCTTARGRGGSDVRVCFDSSDDFAYENGLYQPKQTLFDLKPKNNTYMERTINRHGVDYEVPGDFAAVAAKDFARLDSLEAQTKTWQEKFDTQTTELDKAQGRLDAQEDFVEKAQMVLEDLGYRWDSEDGLFYQDNIEKDESDLHVDNSGLDDNEIIMDETEDEVKADSVSDLLTAWREAERLAPDLKYDSTYSVADIQTAVVRELKPNLKLDGKSADYVAARYDAVVEAHQDMEDKEDESAKKAAYVANPEMKGKSPAHKPNHKRHTEESPCRHDSAPTRPDYTSRLDNAINKIDSDERTRSIEDTPEYQRKDAWKQPL